jgi:hypothetical protein
VAATEQAMRSSPIEAYQAVWQFAHSLQGRGLRFALETAGLSFAIVAGPVDRTGRPLAPSVSYRDSYRLAFCVGRIPLALHGRIPPQEGVEHPIDSLRRLVERVPPAVAMQFARDLEVTRTPAGQRALLARQRFL